MNIKEKLNKIFNSQKLKLKSTNSSFKSLSHPNIFNKINFQSNNNSPIKTEFNKIKRKKIFKSIEKSKKDLNDLSFSNQKLKIDIFNNNILRDEIYKNKLRINYSKKNFTKVVEFFDKKNSFNENRSERLSYLFNERKKINNSFQVKSLKNFEREKEFNFIVNEFKKNQSEKIKKNSLIFANQIEEMFNTENLYNVNKNFKYEKTNFKIINTLHKKIEFNNILKYKKRFNDLDLDELEDNINNIKIQNYKNDNFQKILPKFLKTKFKPSTIIKFGSCGGFNEKIFY